LRLFRAFWYYFALSNLAAGVEVKTFASLPSLILRQLHKSFGRVERAANASLSEPPELPEALA
jgi:hypothetical protein